MSTPSLDLACLLVILLAAVVGAIKGAVPQLSRVAAVVAGWLGARVLGPVLAPALQGRVPAFAAHPIAAVAAFFGCSLAAALVFRLLLRLTPLGRLVGGRADRGIGALLGGAYASVVLWVVLSALAVWNRPVSVGSFRADPDHSQLVAFTREYNAFGSVARPRPERRSAAR